MNTKNIRNKVAKAIKSADYRVDVLRDIVEDDGAGGVIVVDKGHKAFTLECVINNSNKPSRGSNASAPGTNLNYNNTPILVCLYDELKMPTKNDYFYAGGKKYIIEDIQDILMLHVYLQCGIKEVEEYGEWN